MHLNTSYHRIDKAPCVTKTQKNKETMKTYHSYWRNFAAMCLAAGFAFTSQANAQSSAPLGPTGTISAYPTIVRTGTHPTITWDIRHPAPITDAVIFTEDGTVTTKRRLRVEVRVLGASSQYTARNGKRKWKMTEAELTTNHSGWSRFFRGIQPDVNPTRVYNTFIAEKDTVINFRGRNQSGRSSSAMNEWFFSGQSGYNVLAMGDGDLPPIWSGSASQRSPADFIEPYVDGEGKLDLGPRDIVIFFELGGHARYYGDRDTQDLVLLVTFTDVDG